MGNKRIPFEAGYFYHVYNHGNGDDNIFRCDDNYRYFLKKYAQYIYPIAETYAYCLLPNHFHILVKIRPEATLKDFFKEKTLKKSLELLISSQFGHFFNAYTKAYNKRYKRKGSLFLDNVKRKKVESERYLLRLIYYIHFNPVHHDLVKNIDDWIYTSYHSFLINKKTNLQKSSVFHLFGGKKAFVKFHETMLGESAFSEIEF